jgi:hypothetical protein
VGAWTCKTAQGAKSLRLRGEEHCLARYDHLQLTPPAVKPATGAPLESKDPVPGGGGATPSVCVLVYAYTVRYGTGCRRGTPTCSNTYRIRLLASASLQIRLQSKKKDRECMCSPTRKQQ